MTNLIEQVQHELLDLEATCASYEAAIQCAEERIDAIQTRLTCIESRLRDAAELLNAYWRLDQDLRGPAFAWLPAQPRRWVAQREKAADFFHTGWMRSHAFWEHQLVEECEQAEYARTHLELAEAERVEREQELAALYEKQAQDRARYILHEALAIIPRGDR